MPAIVDVTISGPDADWLKSLTRRIVEHRLAASGSVVPSAESVYRRNGAIEQGVEAVAVLNTRQELVQTIIGFTRQEDPGHLVRIYAAHIVESDPEFRQWILDETASAPDSDGVGRNWMPVERASWIFTIAGVFGAILAVLIGYSELKDTREALQSSASSAIAVRTQEVDSIFLDQPDLRPYFYDSKKVNRSDGELSSRVDALSELLLDFFEQIVVDTQLFDAHREGWDLYIQGMFETSPALTDYLIAHCDWWPPGRFDEFTDACRK